MRCEDHMSGSTADVDAVFEALASDIHLDKIIDSLSSSSASRSKPPARFSMASLHLAPMGVM